ncbi:MAG: Gfo/Idh/MocA family oxidoreductase [Bacteroidetes bacterium]|jgi:predicted dehydrogenase|nr:Gfo/Idh/MocA family oxidoreductase [Bacteroidota bacterium]
MGKIRVGVIGTGHLGTFHARVYSQISEAELVGVYDVERERAAALANELRTTSFPSIEALLNNVDAVSVATPTHTHYDIGLEVIKNHVHLIIEKPMTVTVEEAKKLVEEAERNGVKLQVGHIERFNPAILALEPYNLRPLFIESHRLAQFNPRGTDVAVVLDLMIHDIDLILSIVRSPVERIEANGVAIISDTEDIANARLQFQNGCVANVTASRISQNKMRKMRIFQSDAYISIDFAQGLSEVFRLVDEHAENAKPTMLLGKIDQGKKKRLIVYEQPEVKEVNALQVELESFLSAVRNNTHPLVSGKEGLQALEVAEEILKKIKSQPIPFSL